MQEERYKFLHGTSVVMSHLSSLQLCLHPSLAMNVARVLHEAESHKHLNITAPKILLPSRETGNKGPHNFIRSTCSFHMQHFLLAIQVSSLLPLYALHLGLKCKGCGEGEAYQTNDCSECKIYIGRTKFGG